MQKLRQRVVCLLIAVIAAISVNGVALAAIDMNHEIICPDAAGEATHRAASELALDAHHHDQTTQHTAPNPDQDGCMMHACPALSADVVKLSSAQTTIFTKLSWPELSLQILERAEGLKRPPKT